MKMRVLFLMLLLLMTFAAVEAKVNLQGSCTAPSWITTAAPEAGMLPPCTVVTINVLDAANQMRPVPMQLMILGYWTGSLSNPVLYYLEAVNNPQLAFLLDRQFIPNG